MAHVQSSVLITHVVSGVRLEVLPPTSLTFAAYLFKDNEHPSDFGTRKCMKLLIDTHIHLARN
jgi:hypothetical protein